MGHRLTTNDALTYLREVKNRFADKKEVYDTFLEIMKEFKAQRIDTAGVIVRVKDLFRGHKELVLGFNTFLPKGYEIQLADVADMDDDGHAPGPMPHMTHAQRAAAEAPKQPVEFDQAISYVNKIKVRFSEDERVYKAFLEILNMYRKGQKSIGNVYDEVAVLFRNHNDLLREFTYFLPDNSGSQANHPLMNRGGGAAAAPPRGWQGGRPGSSGGPSNRLMVPAQHAQQGAYPGPAGGAFNKRKSMRPDYDPPFPPAPPPQSATLQRELLFFDRVKQRLRSKESYQDFLKCLNLFATDIISRAELLGIAQDIIGRFPDLMAGFNQFLNRCETQDSFDADLKAIAAHTKINLKDLARIKTQTLRDKYFTKPISELAADLCSDDRCTTSYVRVPSGYPHLACSGRTALCDEVLNDTWVSIISGSEDYSFKLMRKNQYEEALFRCEDDRYELDMTIETAAATLRRLRPVLEQLAVMGAEERGHFQLEEGVLRAVHCRSIERIYGDQGAQVVDLLRKNPAAAVPVIVTRLEQKCTEWRRAREEMKKLWRKVFEQNYHKSLDHRSFYFKQADKKALLPKTLMSEVKDAAEKRRVDERQLRGMSVGCPLSALLSPDLAYDYTDPSVFEDVYQVVVFAVEEVVGGEQAGAILRMWHTLVEPFFGRPEREYTGQYAKQGGKRRGRAAKSSSEEVDGAAAPTKVEEGADSGGDEDAAMGEGAPTPEPGSTPEPEASGEAKETAADALEALLGAAAAGEVSEPEGGEAGAKGGEEEGAESSDEAHDRFYSSCKPVKGRVTAAAAASSSGEGGGGAGRVLYGNDNFYLFFRYHRYLYDRLWQAQRCCRDKNTPQFRQTGEVDKPQDAAAAEAARQQAAALHAQFMRMVRSLLVGRMDSSSFEDGCRTLLGTNSYVLFTLDKLVQKLVRHLQAMVADEQTMQLVDLHRYERARRSPFTDEVYRANAHVLLVDDSCFRFELAPPTHASSAPPASITAAVVGAGGAGAVGRAGTPLPEPKQEAGRGEGTGGEAAVPGAAGSSSSEGAGGVLHVQLLEADKSDTQLIVMDAPFASYIKTLLGTSAGPPKGKVFMRRNMRACSAGGSGDGDEVQLLAMLAAVHLANRLECKINCSTSKVSYVLDTEDVMARLGPPRAPTRGPFPGPVHEAHYRLWLERRVAALGALNPVPDCAPRAPAHTAALHR